MAKGKLNTTASPRLAVVFTRNYEVQAPGGAVYTAGQRVELSSASAAHFIERGAARPAGAEEDEPDAKADHRAES